MEHGVQFQTDIHENKIAFVVHVPRQRRIRSFYVVVLRRTAKKCTTNYNARAQPLSGTLNLLFSDVPVAVAVVLKLLQAKFAMVLICSVR